MPLLDKVTTKQAEQVWASPDGQRKIYKLTLEWDGKPVAAKTYSDAIATEGWEGTVETYEKEGRNGSETFVKQPPKEGGSYSPNSGSTQSGSAGSSRSGYVPKDEKAIQAMWAIGQATQLVSSVGTDLKDPTPEQRLTVIETYAQELFAMVERVKASEDAPEAPDKHDDVLDGQITIEDIKDVFPEEE